MKWKILYLPTAEEVTFQRFETKESAIAWINWVYANKYKDKVHLLEPVEV